MSSTPNGSGEIAVTPDVSIIERTCSSSVLVSAESLEDLETDVFEKKHVGPLRLETSIVQRAGHCVIPRNMDRKLRFQPNRSTPRQAADSNLNSLAYMQKLTAELNKSVEAINKTKQKSNLKSSTPNVTPDATPIEPCSSTTKEARKLTKSSSPFKQNFQLQTFETIARQTSPLQKSTCSSKTNATQQCAKAFGNSNLTIEDDDGSRPPRSVPSLSCPGSPRQPSSHPHSRSWSQSPSQCGTETLSESKGRLANALNEIIQKISSGLSTGESNLCEQSRTELSASARAKPAQRNVRFDQRPASADSRPPRGDVDELYFNKGMKTSCNPNGKEGLEPQTELPPWLQASPSGNEEDHLTEKNNSSCNPGNPSTSLDCENQPGMSNCPDPCTCQPRPKALATSNAPNSACPAHTPNQCSSSPQIPCPNKPQCPTNPPCPSKPPCPTNQSGPSKPSCPAQSCPPQPHHTKGPNIQDTGLSGTDSASSFRSTGDVTASDAKRLQHLQNKLHSTQLCDTGLSGTDSASSFRSTGDVTASDAKRLQHLQNKLHSTQLCLKNKEEVVRVQAESLTCAEQRIALLTIRAAQQRMELENCHRELSKLRQGQGGIKAEKSSEAKASGATCADACCAVPSAPSLSAAVSCQLEPHEVENQKNMVVTLQNNLSIIEELYRECFYETAKQEELIEKLRKSYLDVRLMEKEKADQIGRLENVVNTQKWSPETCQDVAVEVENLKLDILNFLNNSNNDSGMWEQPLAGEVGEDINEILQQLHQLRELLQDESTDSNTENDNLRKLVQGLQCKINELCEQKCNLECTVREKDDTINCVRRENDELCCTIRGLQCELKGAKKRVCEVQNEIECVRKQMKEAQEEVGETNAENCSLRTQNAELVQKNECLSEELATADDIIKENCKIRSEVSYLTQQVALWRQQLADSEQRVRTVEAELGRARSHCRHVAQCYKEKVDAVAALEVQLQDAHSRGAQLCAESRRVVATVRGWITRMQATNKEQSQKIKAQESYIAMLQKELQERMGDHSDVPTTEPDSLEMDRPKPPRDTQKDTGREFQRDNARECHNAQNDLYKLTPDPSEYFSSYRAPLSQAPCGVGCSKCAAKRPADPSRSPTDDSDDVLQVGCSKCAPKRKNVSKDYKSEITIDFQVGCSKCATKPISNSIQRNNTEETESGSSSHSTGAAKACGCEREDDSAQAGLCASGTAASSSHTPGPPRRLLRKKLHNDRVTHFLRCTVAPPARSAGVQEPVRSDGATSPPRHPASPPTMHRLASRIPRAVSPTSELLERVSRLHDVMADSQRRWSRTKIPRSQPQRDHR